MLFRSEHINQIFINQLDYTIGSIHFLKRYENGEPWTVDWTYEKFLDGINYSYKGNVQHAIEDYYYYLSKMVSKYKPTVLGHLDLVKKNNSNNKLFDENDKWYKDAVSNCLDIISKTDTVLEINTGAIARGYLSEQYPSNWILEKVRDKNIPVTINSDAHSAESIACKFDEMYKLVKDLKLNNLVYLTKFGWKKMSI